MHQRLSCFADRYSAASFDRQLHLADLVGELADWRFDPDSGVLTFGDRYYWHAQVLGTESKATNTWLWAWANEANNIPPQLLGSALALRLLGENHQIPELTKPQFPFGKIDGHFLAMIASGICQANAYYRCPYEGGAAVLLLKDENFPLCTEPPLARIASVFPQAISSIEIRNHKLALVGYLDHYGLLGEEIGNTLVVKEGEEPVLTATFDDHDRLAKLEVTIKGGTQPPTT